MKQIHSIGQIVHFTDEKMCTHAAIVTGTYNDTEPDKCDLHVNLHVIPSPNSILSDLKNFTYDDVLILPAIAPFSVIYTYYSNPPAPNTWRYPPFVPPTA